MLHIYMPSGRTFYFWGTVILLPVARKKCHLPVDCLSHTVRYNVPSELEYSVGFQSFNLNWRAIISAAQNSGQGKEWRIFERVESDLQYSIYLVLVVFATDGFATGNRELVLLECTQNGSSSITLHNTVVQ